MLTYFYPSLQGHSWWVKVKVKGRSCSGEVPWVFLEVVAANVPKVASEKAEKIK